MNIEFLTKTPKIWKTTWKICNKLTNWSSHKIEYTKKWSITSIQQANFIRLNQIEQNPQIGFYTSPRIFNFSQNPKLIKLTNIDHEYIIVGKKKSLIKFIKQGLINKKSQIKHSSKITQKPWDYAWKWEKQCKRKGKIDMPA